MGSNYQTESRHVALTATEAQNREAIERAGPRDSELFTAFGCDGPLAVEFSVQGAAGCLPDLTLAKSDASLLDPNPKP